MMGHKIKTLQSQVECGNIRQHRINDELSLYKYTPQCVFTESWNEFTLMCRGLVLDNEYEIVANCIPKFFNYEQNVGDIAVNTNQPFTVTEKSDGSLIQVFMHKGEMFITSSGASNNEYTQKALELLNTKYDRFRKIIESTEHINFVFELIAPLTRVVVSYGDLEELRLIAKRDVLGNEDDTFLKMSHQFGMDHVKTVDFNDIDSLVAEKQTKPDNAEGFVVKFADGARLKFKYNDYFLLHRTATRTSKLFVWNFLSSGRKVDLEGIPDETFNQIKDWERELKQEFDALKLKMYQMYDKLFSESLWEDRKTMALWIMKHYKEHSKFMFAIMDEKNIDDMVWKSIRPTVDK